VVRKYAALKEQGGFSTAVAPTLDEAQIAFKQIDRSMDSLMKFKRISF
jgi:hypothetical protein